MTIAIIDITEESKKCYRNTFYLISSFEFQINNIVLSQNKSMGSVGRTRKTILMI